METKFETKVTNNPLFRLNYFMRVLPKLKEIRKYDGEKYSIIFDMKNGPDHTSLWFLTEEERDSQYEYYRYMMSRYYNNTDDMILPAINIFSRSLIEQYLHRIIALVVFNDWNFVDNTFDLAVVLDTGVRIYCRHYSYRTMRDRANEYAQFLKVHGTNDFCISWKEIYEEIKQNKKYLKTS